MLHYEIALLLMTLSLDKVSKSSKYKLNCYKKQNTNKTYYNTWLKIIYWVALKKDIYSLVLCVFVLDFIKSVKWFVF